MGDTTDAYGGDGGCKCSTVASAGKGFSVEPLPPLGVHSRGRRAPISRIVLDLPVPTALPVLPAAMSPSSAALPFAAITGSLDRSQRSRSSSSEVGEPDGCNGVADTRIHQTADGDS